MSPACPYCYSRDAEIIERGYATLPDLYECDNCGEEFEDPDHEETR